MLKGLPFPKRARFIFLEGQFGTEVFWTRLVEAVGSASPAYAAALAGVRARGGIVTRKQFDIACGSPVRQDGQLSAETVLERLRSVRLLHSEEIEGYGECIALDGARGDLVARASLKARQITEDLLIEATRGWLGRMNWASPKATSIRNDATPQFATFRFDICGPCYLRPLTRHQNNKINPGFLVADIVLGARLDEQEVAPFIRKCEMLSYLKGIRPFMPMLIAEGFSPEALRACRSEGIVATTPESLFGRDVARGLKDLLETLSRAGAVAATNPKKIEHLFTSLSSIEGAATNLRGALFELIVGHMVRSIEGGSIDIGDIARDLKTGEQREIDVRLVKERNVTIIECKGYQPTTTVTADEIDSWLKKKVPVIDRAHRQQPRFDGMPLTFEFWTCGTFDDDALQLLKETSERVQKYNLAWRDGTAVREYAKELKAAGIRKILDEHYFNHVLAQLPVTVEDLAIEVQPQRNSRRRVERLIVTEEDDGMARLLEEL
ncbi:hypothetical protein RSO01_75910 [Reyranella soli]|uniref:Uncharacterized protein n=1 Tax=Reyranella soli TaxID=1230389 RepID=A0A512NNA1_9HYPH|nr:hypothetical protein RSO01_75910 [Reyranella soli]